MADRELRLASERARSALTGTITKGRVRYEASCRERGAPADYRAISRGARVDWELAAKNDLAPTPQHAWRRI